ncbi:MAG: hypothetical protein IKG22_09405, partial [Atopobiaceae bacterium]|nr:hypothetical protein [Atopobiaceae bacterium]
RYCSSLTEIDLSGFDTSKVTNAKDIFVGCNNLKKWIVNASWPVELEGAIPAPTAENEMWWSTRDGRWMSTREIRDRGPVADTYTSAEPGSST